MADVKALIRKGEIADRIPLIVRMLSENLPTQAIPRVIVRAAKELFDAAKVGYFASSGDSKIFTLKDCSGYPTELLNKIKVHADEGILGAALQKKEVVSRHDPLSSTGTRPGKSSFESCGIEVDIVAPIYVDATNLGVLVLSGCRVDIESERKYVAMLADLASGALQNAVKSDQLKSASLDSLTGLYTRRYFTEWFEAELRRANNYRVPLSIFLFDIDHFKAVNDTYGHNAGDLVLRKLGKLIRRHTRGSDLVARYGGEEFVSVMTSADKEQAFRYADALRKTIAETRVSIPDVEAPIGVTISGGVSSFPTDGKSTADLIHAADQALYGAKRERRNEVVLAQPIAHAEKPVG